MSFIPFLVYHQPYRKFHSIWYDRSTASEYIRNYRHEIVEQATSLLGRMSIRYIAGHPEKGQSPAEGFDCSGFVRFILLQCGLLVPDFIGMDGIIRPIRHASEFWDHYGIGTHEVRPGDLIFFSRHGEWPTHVGIVRDEESFIHAPGRNGTKVEVSGITPQDIEPKAAAHAILYTRNPIGYKSPVVPHEQPSYRYHQRAV